MKKFWGKDETQRALERLDRLTKDEGLSALVQTLGIVHGIADDMKEVVGGAQYFRDFLRYLSKYCTCSVRWKGTEGWYRTEFRYVFRAIQVSP